MRGVNGLFAERCNSSAYLLCNTLTKWKLFRLLLLKFFHTHLLEVLAVLALLLHQLHWLLLGKSLGLGLMLDENFLFDYFALILADAFVAVSGLCKDLHHD
jgi:hypothetical protein